MNIKRIAEEMVYDRLKLYPQHFRDIASIQLTNMVAEFAKEEFENTDVGIVTCIGNLLNHPIDIIEVDGELVVGIFEGHPGIDTLMMSTKIYVNVSNADCGNIKDFE